MSANNNRLLVPREKQTVVMYDPADGRVVHLHTVAPFGEARMPTPDELRSEAFRRAQRRGRPVDRLQTLLLRGDLPVGKIIRVDVARGELTTSDIPGFPGL